MPLLLTRKDVESVLTMNDAIGAVEEGFRPRVAPDAGSRSAIVTLPSADPRADVARLAARHIVTDARPGHVRISPFFYNTVEDHVAALGALRS